MTGLLDFLAANLVWLGLSTIAGVAGVIGWLLRGDLGDLTVAREEVPWVLVTGPLGAGTTTLLHALGLRRRRPRAKERGAIHRSLEWNFFDQGIAVDIDGALISRADGTVDEAGWAQLRLLLKQRRFARRVKSLVLTLSARQLEHAGRGDAASLQELGRDLSRRVRDLQQTLGMSLPVYVIVTQCDSIDGFATFASALPERLRHDMLGWSSPYAADQAFSPTWIDEAFAHVAGDVRQASSEVLALHDTVERRDALFMLADRLRGLSSATRQVLDDVFRFNLDGADPRLRGLYLSGDIGASQSSAARAVNPGFADALFSSKVFCETGLTRPIGHGRSDRGRSIWWMKAAMLALTLVALPGLWLAHRQLSEQVMPLEADLRQVEDGLQSVARDGGRDVPSVPRSDRRVPLLLQDMDAVDARTLWSLTMPTSWLHSLQRDVEGSLADGFGEVLMPALRAGIVAASADLAQAEWDNCAPDAEGPVGAATELVCYLRLLRDHSAAVERFNAIGGEDPANVEAQTAAFAAVISWYFDSALPSEFRSEAPVFLRGLQGAPPAPITLVELPAFDRRAARVADVLVRRVYADLEAQVRDIAEIIEVWAYRLPDDLSAARTDLQTLRDDLAHLEQSVALLDRRWFEAQGPVPPVLTGLADSIVVSSLLPAASGEPSVTAFAGEFGEAFMQARRQGLAALEGRLDAPPGVESGSDLVAGIVRVCGDQGCASSTLAPWLVQLREGLDALLTSRFMRVSSTPASEVPTSAMAMPSWNAGPLSDVLGDLRAVDAFFARQLDRFPPSLRTSMRQAAMLGADVRIRDAIAQAMVYEVAAPPAGRQGQEFALMNRFAAFDVAARRLLEVLEADAALGGRADESIAAVLALEVSDLLAVAEDLLDTAALYGAGGRELATWRGGQPAAWVAFGVQGPDQLELYLADQRRRVTDLVEGVAAPLLGYLELPVVWRVVQQGQVELGAATVARIERWRGLVQTLDGYGVGAGGNPLALLERFIMGPMVAAVDAESCPASLDRLAPGRDDFFLQVRDQLARALERRCASLLPAGR